MTAAQPLEEPLDQRLVRHALRILSDEGAEALTLRRLAREAGVSHAAPLRHFASLASLRAEVAARGFTLLSAALEDASTELAPGVGALPRLAAAGRAYVRVAVANPSLFALMFRPEQLDLTNPHFLRDSVAAFERLVHLVRAAQDAGWRADHDTRLLAGSVWSAVHGFASLWAQGALAAAVPNGDFDNALATTLELVLGTFRGDAR